MVFGNISTLYFPVAGSAGASQWGTDVRKLLDAADGTADGTTICNHGTGGAVTRTCDPYTTATADLDQTLYGWAVTPSDMNSVAGARRFYPAGDHTATFRMHQNGAVSVAVTVTVYVYRVGPSPGRTRTLLGSGSASPTLQALSAHATVNVTVSLPEIVFEPDETIQYSIETNVSGVVVTGRNVVFWTGTDGGVEVRMDTPQLGVLKDFTGAADGSSAASGVMAQVLPTIGTAISVGTASGVLAAAAGFSGAAVGTSTALGVPSSLSGTVGAADGFSDAEGVLGAVIGTVGTVMIGGACPADWGINDGLKAISGIVFDHETGALVAGATVCLVRDSDALQVGCVTSGIDGSYTFPRDTNDPNTYYTIVTSGSGQGRSEGGCAPS